MNKLEKLKSIYDFPQVDALTTYVMEVDGGGRELVEEIIRSKVDPIMIEIGCFLCGSSRRWLNASPTLSLLGVDPWDDEIIKVVERYRFLDWAKPILARTGNVEKMIADLKTHGAYLSACANVKEYASRFTPIRGRSPEILYDLAKHGIDPDIIYIDALKLEEDLHVANNLFPQAILCGDDWTWGKDQGYPMRTAVMNFVSKYGFSVKAEKATWVIYK
jgi:hypothetical protein